MYKLYKRFISPAVHYFFYPVTGSISACRFEPTCSTYGHQAIHKYGIIRGSIKSLNRFLRCHPWSSGGYDPVL